ncbi:MAG: hypothetical protein HY820_10945 [Acidobacteria bacterium]|nr:hypothetical protein [Acidobacteriota bacterium]
MCHEAIRLSYQNAGRAGLLGAPTYPMLRDSTQRAFLEILEQNEIPFELNRGDNVLRMGDTGSVILFRSLEEFERLRGTNLAWFGVDELTYTHEEGWLRLEGRLRDPKAKRLCGFGVWTPKGYDWVYRRFVKQAGESYKVTFAKAKENRHILDAVPDFYERLKNTYGEEFYRQEVLGEYVEAGTDRAYRKFNEGTHVRKKGINDEQPLLWSLDFNVDPMCSVVAQRDGEALHVVDEIVLRRSTTVEACEEFWGRYRGHWSGVHVYGDASGAHGQTSGKSDHQVIREFFTKKGQRDVELRVLRSNPGVKERIELVNARLLNAAREVRLTVDEKCKKLIVDLEEVSFQKGTFTLEKSKHPELTHLSDALGYLIWYEFGNTKKYGEQGNRLL